MKKPSRKLTFFGLSGILALFSVSAVVLAAGTGSEIIANNQSPSGVSAPVPAPDEKVGFINPETEEVILCPDGSKLEQSAEEAIAPVEEAMSRGEVAPPAMPVCADGKTPQEYLDMVVADARDGGLDNDQDHLATK